MKKVLNVMRNPKLAYILVSFKGSGVTAILRLSRAGRQQQLPPAAAVTKVRLLKKLSPKNDFFVQKPVFQHFELMAANLQLFEALRQKI